MKTYGLWLLLTCSVFTGIFAQKPANISIVKYTKVSQGYVMVLREGDNVFEQLELFAIQEKIPSANLTGMGFAEVVLGFYNLKAKKYKPKRFATAELASMNGTIAWQSGMPSVHLHGVVAGKNFKAHGGHILSAFVGKGSIEIMIVVHDKRLERKKDEALGANVLCLDKCK
ncbi:MAG: PPC domain-containing DNA-binding protein [Bacteroidota bacterium]